MRSEARVAGAMICFFELGRGENGAGAISSLVSRVVADSKPAELPMRTRWGTATVGGYVNEKKVIPHKTTRQTDGWTEVLVSADRKSECCPQTHCSWLTL